MKNYIGYLTNLFNEKKYFRNVGDVKVTSKANTMIGKLEEDSNLDNKLQETFIEDRRANKEVYLSTITGAAVKKTFAIYLPIFLIISTGLAWFGPKTRDTITRDKYLVTESVITDESTKTKEPYYAYYQSADTSYDYVKDDIQTIESSYDHITYYLQDDGEGIKSNLYLDDNNELQLSSNRYPTSEGYYVDTSTDTSKTEQTDVYSELFDEVTNFLLKSDALSTSEKEQINKLNSSKKREYVIEIIKKEYQGTEEVEVYSHHWAWRIVLSIITAIYALVYLTMLEEGYIDFDFRKLNNRNGILIKDNYQGLYNLSLQYHKSLVAAEKERIKNSICVCKEEGVPEEEIRNILTDFEIKIAEKYGYLTTTDVKKLVKEKKNNV